MIVLVLIVPIDPKPVGMKLKLRLFWPKGLAITAPRAFITRFTGGGSPPMMSVVTTNVSLNGIVGSFGSTDAPPSRPGPGPGIWLGVIKTMTGVPPIGMGMGRAAALNVNGDDAPFPRVMVSRLKL